MDLLKSSLKTGLELLRAVDPRSRLWLPLLGTGQGGLSPEQSAKVMLDVLSAWPRGSTEMVRLAAPSPEVARQLMEFLHRYTPASTAPQTTDLSLEPDDIEVHVARALHAARIIAEGQVVTALHVLIAVVTLADSVKSNAFSMLRKLVGLKADTRVGPSGRGFESGMPFEPSALSEELRRWLTWAQQRPGSEQRRRLWGRDLVTAALLCTDAGLAQSLDAAQTPLDDVRNRWFNYVTSDDSNQGHQDWSAWWRAAGVPLPGFRRAGYATETDEGDDKLGVETEAAAFARLILDEQVTPPLSIGLLGDWGSGKSFFIEQIKKQIAQLRGQPGLYEHVVEIEFNAWQASDANLWASLVTYIFDEIWKNVAVENEDADRDMARQKLLQELEKAGGAVHEAESQVGLARATLANAEADLEKYRRQLALSHYVESVTTENLRRIARQVGWQKPLEIINEVENAARRLASVSERLSLMMTTLVERPLTTAALPALLVGVVTTGVVLVLQHVELPPWAAQVFKTFTFKTFTAISGGLCALLAPLQEASRKVRSFTKSVEEVVADYDRKLEDLKTTDPQGAASVLTARRELESAEASVTSARAHLAELQTQLAALDPGRRLGAFLQERVQSTQYRSQQGIIALVHKDFQQLSERMKDWRKARATSQPPGGALQPPASIKPFDRIVIYVDDLDRCRPDHVVHMLEAVHLLLSLDLFVVVVAVDSRWLMRALQVHYKDLLTASTDAEDDDGPRVSTVQNYLEKIFQITYALAPMDSSKFMDYVNFLAGAEKMPLSPAGSKAQGSAAVETTKDIQPDSLSGAASGAMVANALGGAVTLRGAESGLKQRSIAQNSSSGAKVVLPPPYAVRISDTERTFLGDLAFLLPTPRIAKRLVNVYRLIKAAKTMEALEAFDREGCYQPCLLMLAILFGRPSLSLEFFRSLHERRPPFDKPRRKLVEALREFTTSGATDPGDTQWAFLIDELKRIKIELTVEDCARESYEVARYSLMTGRDWHTWGPGKAAK